MTKLLLPSLLILFIGVTLVHPQISIGQTNANFLTYTNPELGFTIEYPSEWTIVEFPTSVSIRSPDYDMEAQLGFRVEVGAWEANQSEVAYLPPQPTLADLDNYMLANIKNLSQDIDVRLVEVNNDTYYLGGHPAVRMILVMTALIQTIELRMVD